jgi:hypothetical protein
LSVVGDRLSVYKTQREAPQIKADNRLIAAGSWPSSRVRYALALRQAFGDDRVAVEPVVRRPLIVPPITPPAIGDEVLLDCLDCDVQRSGGLPTV